MSEKTMTLLLTALTEEIEALRKKQQYQEVKEPMVLGEWCRREQAFVAFGLSPHRLKKLVIDRKVVAKKMEPSEPSSVVVFKTADIRKAIEEMPNYMYENNSKEES